MKSKEKRQRGDAQSTEGSRRVRNGFAFALHGEWSTFGSSRTENPASSAASDSRWSPQMKVLLDGRSSHQIKDAASCRLSAARKEYLSSDCAANSRILSPGRISLQPRLSNRKRATAPFLPRPVISFWRWRRQIAL